MVECQICSKSEVIREQARYPAAPRPGDDVVWCDILRRDDRLVCWVGHVDSLEWHNAHLKIYVSNVEMWPRETS